MEYLNPNLLWVVYFIYVAWSLGYADLFLIDKTGLKSNTYLSMQWQQESNLQLMQSDQGKTAEKGRGLTHLYPFSGDLFIENLSFSHNSCIIWANLNLLI